MNKQFVPNKTIGHDWVLNLIAARLGLVTLVLIYFLLAGGVSAGGLGPFLILAAISVYLILTLLLASLKRGGLDDQSYRRLQTVLDNAVLVVSVPHDPGVAMPTLLFLALSPLDYGVRYTTSRDRFRLTWAALATLAIITIRVLWIDQGISLEAIGLLFFTWAAMLYGLTTIHSIGRLREDTAKDQATMYSNLTAIGAVSWYAYPEANEIHFQGNIYPLLQRPAGDDLTDFSEALSYVHEDDRTYFSEELMHVYQEGAHVDFEYRIRPDKTGPAEHYRVSALPMLDDNDSIVGIRGLLVSNQNKVDANKKIRDIYDSYQLAMQAVGFATWRWDLTGPADNINPVYESLLGFEPGGFDGQLITFLNLVHPQDRNHTANTIQAGTVNARGFEVSLRLIRPNGEMRWMTLRGEPMQISESGEITIMAGVIWDITEEMEARSQTEKALAQIEQATRMSKIGFWRLDSASLMLEVNQDWRTLTGIAKDIEADLAYVLQHLIEEDRSVFNSTVQTVLQDGGSIDTLIGWLRPDTGELLHVRIRGSSVRKEDGSIMALTGVCIDETKIHLQRVKYDELRTRHELSMRAANIGGWTWDVESQEIQVDAILNTIFDAEYGASPETLTQFLECVHATDRDKVNVIMLAQANAGEGFEISYRRKMLDGSLRWTMSRGEPVDKAIDGSAIRMAGATWDIDDLAQAREQAEQALARVDEAAEDGRIGFWSLDKISGECNVDQNLRNMIGYPLDAPQPTENQALAWAVEADREGIAERFVAMQKKGTHIDHQYRMRHLSNGQIMHLQIRGDAQRDTEGNITRFSGHVSDQTEITEQRFAIDALRARQNQVLISAGVASWNYNAESDRYEFDAAMPSLIGVPTNTTSHSLDQVKSIMLDEDQDRILRELGSAIHAGESITVEYRICRPDDKKIRWLRSLCTPVFDGDGKPISFGAVVMDITEQAQARHALELARKRYNDGMQTAGIGNWVVHMQTQTVEIDDILLGLLEVDPESYDGSLQGALEFFIEPDRPLLTEAIHSAPHSRSQIEVNLRRIMPDGQIRWFCVRGGAVKKDDHNLNLISGASWDITVIAELTEALKRSNQELDDFAQIASHDLREPLRGLHNYAIFLNEDYATVLDDEGRRMLSALGRLAQRLDDLIKDLLHLSRLGRSELAIKETDLNGVLQDVLTTLEFSLKEKAVEIRILGPLPTLPCDGVRVGELLRNLITNAVKYNDKEEKWVEIGYKNEVFHVRDNGIGIAQEHTDRVFTIFKRLHGQEAYGGGTGAGLTIAQQIAQRHGGRLWLESTLDEGTTFYFTIKSESPWIS